jgi:hypothetical protein
MARTLNTSHPLYANLTYLIGIEDDGTTLKDFVTGRTFTLRDPSSGADPSIGTGTFGTHFRTGGAYAEPGGWTFSPAITPSTGAATALYVVNAVHVASTDSNAVGRESFFLGNTGGMNGAAGALQVCTDSSGFIIAHNVDSGGSNYAAVSSTAIVSASAHLLAAVRTNTNPRTLRLHINDAIAATNASAGDNTAASRQLNAIGGQQSGAVGTMDASIVWLVGFNKECSEAEIDDLYASLGASNAFGLFSVASTLSGGITLADLVAAGAFGIEPPSTLSGAITLGDIVAAGAFAMQPGTFTVPELRNWAGLLLMSQLVENVVVIRIADRALLAAFTNLTSDGGTGNLTGSSSALIPGTACLVVGFNADGSQRFARPVTIA